MERQEHGHSGLRLVREIERGKYKRILVTGGRDFGDALLLNEVLEAIAERSSQYFHPTYSTHEWHPFDLVLIHGAASTGADELANQWAVRRRAMIERYPAQWSTFGSMSGRVRNARMLMAGKPHLVVAFEGMKGTAHMKQIAREARLPVIEIPPRRIAVA